jgi:hypothetical protein
MLAKEENVGVLGINDFNTIDGHELFAEVCEKYNVFPIFNIEFATLIESDRVRGNRWNDITYPGMMYLCGKALDFPINLSSDSKNLLASVWKVSQDRIWKIIANVNEYMQSLSLDIVLDYQEIRSLYAKQAVRERHLAKALYMSFVEKWNDPNLLLEKFRDLFQADTFTADLADAVFLQNEIRNRLFRPGKVGYIDENYSTHIKFTDARSLILSSGGIPCYPLFLDGSQNMTEKEISITTLISELQELEIHAVEFISNRVPFDKLKNYVRAFHELGFCVSFGTEHCTSERYSLIPGTLGGRPFDTELEEIAYEGACIYAAHQQLHKMSRPGFVNDSGKLLIDQSRLKNFIRIGDEAIKKVTQRETVTLH